MAASDGDGGVIAHHVSAMTESRSAFASASLASHTSHSSS